MLTLADLGILRAVDEDGGTVVATITPTYSGCPAMREISVDLEHRLHAAGYAEVSVRTLLSPPWSSDWITVGGREKLAAAGIAPPHAARHGGPVALTLSFAPRRTVSGLRGPGDPRDRAFSGTACKSLHRCSSCGDRSSTSRRSDGDHATTFHPLTVAASSG